MLNYLLNIGHDLIAKWTWNSFEYSTIKWICNKYEICNYEDFQTLSALPDLLKHEERFMKYFDLHFYNNPYDQPPRNCRIDFNGALDNNQPNILKAIRALLTKFEKDELSFIELSYFVHLFADLHQPFHRIIVI